MSGLLRTSLRPAVALRSTTKSSFHNSAVRNVAKSNEYKETRVNPFTMAGLFKHYELLPLVGIVAAGAAALGVYALYFCNTRNDVQFRKKGTYDSMDLQKPPVLKMVNTKDYKEYQPLTELENLYKDMAEAEALQKTQNNK